MAEKSEKRKSIKKITIFISKYCLFLSVAVHHMRIFHKSAWYRCCRLPSITHHTMAKMNENSGEGEKSTSKRLRRNKKRETTTQCEARNSVNFSFRRAAGFFPSNTLYITAIIMVVGFVLSGALDFGNNGCMWRGGGCLLLYLIFTSARCFSN